MTSLFLPRLRLRRSALTLAAVACATGLLTGPVFADRIKNPTAVFEGLDKITGRLLPFEVAMNETVQFGSLQVTPRACYTRPATEAPQTDTFVEIDEISPATNEYKRIFGGWMYAASPGLHALENPIYDVWLTDCKGGDPVKDLIKTPPDVAALGDAAPVASPRSQAPPPPKPGTVPRPRKAAGEPGVTLPGIPLPGETSPAVTSEPLPPPVPTARKKPSQRYFPTNVPPSSAPPPPVPEPPDEPN